MRDLPSPLPSKILSSSSSNVSCRYSVNLDVLLYHMYSSERNVQCSHILIANPYIIFTYILICGFSFSNRQYPYVFANIVSL